MLHARGTRRRLPEQRAVFAVPGDLNTLTGGYAYARRMLTELGAAGWDVHHLPLGEGFPDPTAQTLAHAYRLLASQPEDVPLLVDGLALGAMPGIAQALGERQPLVALIHHPLALESGLDCDRARALATTERAALAAACHVVTTSRTTACTLERDYGVSAERITVVVPGTDAVQTARGSGSQQLALLSVGTLVPRKGHDLLLAALAALQDLPWHLTIVGDAHRDPATALALREAALRAGLAGRVVFAGAVDATHLSAHYERADLFVLASRHEGFGMAFAEALAYGLPLLGTTAGAIPEAVPAGAGMLVPPNDLPALTEALRVLLSDQATRKQLGASARAAAAALQPWHASAAVLAGVLREAAQ